METEIKPIKLEITDDRYFQAVAILVDNPRFLKVVSRVREKFIDGESLSQFGMDEVPRMENARMAEKIVNYFDFPNSFSFPIYTAIVYGEIADYCLVVLKKIDWNLENQIYKKYKKGSLCGDYFHQKPFQYKTITNFRQERVLFWKYIPYKYGYKNIAKETGINYETVKSAIKTYRKRISY